MYVLLCYATHCMLYMLCHVMSCHVMLHCVICYVIILFSTYCVPENIHTSSWRVFRPSSGKSRTFQGLYHADMCSDLYEKKIDFPISRFANKSSHFLFFTVSNLVNFHFMLFVLTLSSTFSQIISFYLATKLKFIAY